MKSDHRREEEERSFSATLGEVRQFDGKGEKRKQKRGKRTGGEEERGGEER
jgi:hypothetical protein